MISEMGVIDGVLKFYARVFDMIKEFIGAKIV